MSRQLIFLFQDFKYFLKKDFHLKAYAYTLAVIVLSIFIVYCTSFGQSIQKNSIPTHNKIMNNVLLFLFMYFIIAVPVLIFKKEYHILKRTAFWIKAVLFVTLIGISDQFQWRKVIDFSAFAPLEVSYLSGILWRSTNLIFILPVFILYRIFIDTDVRGLYGVCRGNHHIPAYLSLYVLILPLLTAVSFTPDFQSYYPSFCPWAYEHVFNLPAWCSTLIYETVYMSDFFMVELIFRGAMVIGMASFLGRNAVLPMTAIYVTLHFGKPVLETMSAIAGGYFLGTLAYQTRHIWGGIVIHLGIALIIELLRFFQHYVLGIG